MILLVFDTNTLIASIAVFLVLTLLLVAVLLIAKAKLMPQGKMVVNINKEKQIPAQAGATLLSTLGDNKIFLPSACGGGGTCGMCRCKVHSGAGTILPTETGFFSRKEQMNDWRLACQVKVKDNIELEIPQEILGIKKWECEVVSNNNVATFIKEFVVKLPEGENLNFRSGGYIQIDVPKIDVDFKDIDVDEKYRGDWEKFGMFNLKMTNPTATYRAYSMANHPAEGNIIMLNIRIATPPLDREKGGFMDVNPGICSSYIFSRKPGDKVTISGPFGEFFLKDGDEERMFIGGGAGMAPMRSHLFHIFHTVKDTDRKVTFWYGARSWQEVFYYDQFKEIEKNFPNFEFHLALDRPDPVADELGVEYKAGFVHQVIAENYLKQHEEPEGINYYMCGPPMMNAAVEKMLYDLGVPDENIAYDNFGG